MCGIVGYIGDGKITEILYNGLKRLEYRGYDSSGIALVKGDQISNVKESGKLASLVPHLEHLPADASSGLGHTRWATHGPATQINAHPHNTGRLVIVHNGIIDNQFEIRSSLTNQGEAFISDTDTEVILKAIECVYRKTGNLFDSIKETISEFSGSYAFCIISADDPNVIYGVKNGAPLVVGTGSNESYIASDAMAFFGQTGRVYFLQDREIAVVKKDKIEIFDFAGKKIPHAYTDLDMGHYQRDKGEYRHFMLKEIHEQPKIMAKTIAKYVSPDFKTLKEDQFPFGSIDINKVKRIHIVACGTAYYSGLLGQYALEAYANIPVQVELASEFRYREPVIDDQTLIIPVSQSGETADTLACVKYAQNKECQILSLCNSFFSSIPRESHGTIYMEAGPEICVASTKAFTSMVINFYLLALGIAQKSNSLAKDTLQESLRNLEGLPTKVDEALSVAAEVEKISANYVESSHCIFLGRGAHYPIALESALKLKEISYIHAEGYAGGELKHGPIALVDRNMPIIALVPDGKQQEKIIANIEEVAAREGQVVAVGSPDNPKLKALTTGIIPCPQIEDSFLQAIVSMIPMQLFSYHVAVRRGTDVDQPRNLAKSVTVE